MASAGRAALQPGKLALFVPDLEGGGGAPRSMLTLARAFAREGHAVDLLAARPVGSLRSDLGGAVQLVSLERWWSRVPGVSGNKRRRSLAAVPALVRYLRDVHPATLLSTSHSANVAAGVACARAGAGTRLVLRVDSQLSRAPTLANTPRQRRRMRRARRWFPRADAIVAISKGVADDLRACLGEASPSIETIYNPAFHPGLEAAARETCHHAWLSEPGPPVVLAVGRLVPQKDFATLLRAFARLRARAPARLLILGEGPERSRLAALARSLGTGDDVDLPGEVPTPLPHMARAAMLVLSSAWEGFGNVLVEAMACGCPVASTDCPSGPAEILEGGALGPLVAVGDDEALAAAMAALLEKPTPAERLQVRARSFSVEHIAEQYLEVLRGDTRPAGPER